MKNKILTASLVFLMSVSSFSCGKTNDSETEPKSAEIIVNEEATENTVKGRDVPLVGFSTKENERKVLLGGSQEEIDYNTIIEKKIFIVLSLTF